MGPADDTADKAHDGVRPPPPPVPPPPVVTTPVPPPPVVTTPVPPPPVVTTPVPPPPPPPDAPAPPAPIALAPPPPIAPVPSQSMPAPVAGPRLRRWYNKPANWIGVGVGVVVIAAAAVLFTLYRPSFVVSAIEAPEAVVSGEDVVVRVLLENSGWGTGDHELSLLVDGDVARTEAYTVEGSSESWFDMNLADLGPGRYTVTVADVEELSAAVWVMTPPEFVIDSITVAPNPLNFNASHEATLLVQVSNIGEADGSHEIELNVDGVATDSRSLSLAGGATSEETFAIAVTEPGMHEVRVEEAVATLRVNQLERPGNGAVLLNSVGGGSNELRIVNNSQNDLLVVLTAPGPGQPALLSVYVHAASTHTVTGIRDGVYSTYYAFGADWCTYGKEFTRNTSYGRFEQDASYTSSRSYFTYYTLEMGATTGGVPTVDLPQDSFPAM